jgi:hypothetical protein
MTTRAVLKRLLLASVIAAFLAAVLIVFSTENVRANEGCEGSNPDETCFVVYWPGICSYLDPDSYWYWHFNCGGQVEGFTAMDAERETVNYHELPDGRILVEIIREFPGGQRAQIIRELKGR